MNTNELFDEINREFADRLTLQAYQDAGAHLEEFSATNRGRRIEEEKERAWAKSNGFTIQDVIEEFVKGRYLRASGNVWSQEQGSDAFPTLYSYETPIGIRLSSREIAINPNKYGVTTSRHQSWLRKTVTERDYVATDDLHLPPSSGQFDHQTQDAFVIYKQVRYDLTHEQEAELMAKYDRQRRWWQELQDERATLIQEDVGYIGLIRQDKQIDLAHDRMEKILAMIGGRIPYDKGV